MAMLIINPERYVKSVYNGVLIFGASVLPALFPFFFFTRLLTGLNFANSIADIAEKPVTKLFKTPPVSAYIFIMSILSGYPVGARLLSDFYREGVLTADDCKKISAFTSTSGPLFIVGTIGNFMLHDKKSGYIILTAHILSAIFNGILYRNIHTLNNNNKYINLPLSNYDNILSESITGAVSSIFIVGGYIAIFNMVIDLALDIHIIDYLAKPFEYMIFFINGDLTEAVKPFLISMVEVTRGVLEFSKTALKKPVLSAFIASVISLGGLSITLQSLTFLSACKVPVSFYFKTKFTQSIFAFIFAYLLALIFI